MKNLEEIRTELERAIESDLTSPCGLREIYEISNNINCAQSFLETFVELCQEESDQGKIESFTNDTAEYINSIQDDDSSGKDENLKTTKKEYFENSIYILSNNNINEVDAWGELDDDEIEFAEFIEFDYAVANHYGYQNCAIFHISE